MGEAGGATAAQTSEDEQEELRASASFSSWRRSTETVLNSEFYFSTSGEDILTSLFTNEMLMKVLISEVG